MVTKNRGLIKQKLGGGLIVTDIPIPKLRDDYLLVRTVAVALNPADWQNAEGSSPIDLLNGHDYAGIIEAVGQNVHKSFKKGDRVCGVAHGANDAEPEDGTFAEYIMVKGDVALRIPSNVSFEEAATMGCGIGTVALGLYKHLSLPLPPVTPDNKNPKDFLLVYGGSSATGTLAIQFAKLSGLTVVTTSSPRNFELLKSFGADHVIDYHDPECGSKIRAITQDRLTKVFDTIATPATAQICADAISSSEGGTYCELMGTESPRADVKSVFFLGYTGLGEAFNYEGQDWQADLEEFDCCVEFINLAEKLLAQGKLRAHPPGVRDGGLEGIEIGLQELKMGKVSGEKLVYRIS